MIEKEQSENWFGNGLAHLIKEKKAQRWDPSKDKTSYGTGNMSNVLCGSIDVDGESQSRQYACHNPIRSFMDSRVLWSAFGTRTATEESSTFFLDWLMHESPWAKTGLLDDLNKKLSLKEVVETGVVFDKLDQTSANLLHNFLIAFRAPAEWPLYVEDWYELVTQHSLDPSFAFFFMAVFFPLDCPGNDGLTWARSSVESILRETDKYDWPLDTARSSEDYLRNFLDGNPVGKSTTMFFPSAVTSPINVLWGKALENFQSKGSYVGFLSDTYSKDFSSRRLGLLKSSGLLGLSKQPLRDRVFTKEAIIEIIRLEMKRLLK